MSKRRSFIIPLSLFSLSLVLTGCTLETTAPPEPVDGSSLQGLIHGGQQAVVGSHVYLFAVNTTGYGGAGIAASPTINASTSLLKSANTGFSDSVGAFVYTDNNGFFTITAADYTCPTASTQVYLYALGGNAGGGTNTYAGFLAGLGSCGSLGSLPRFI
jgi:hypothetical protein